MLYKEISCPVCGGLGVVSGWGNSAVYATPCANCQHGVIVVPMTNGDLIRKCTNEELLKVHMNLINEALYSGGEHNRLLDSSAEDFMLWLNKNTDELDLKTIFDFINVKDYEHPWLKGAALEDFE